MDTGHEQSGAGQQASGEYWRHPYYSYVDHQLDPLMEVLRDQASPGGFLRASATELRGMIDAVRAAMDSLEADLLPSPPAVEQAAAHGLVLGRRHVHDEDPDGSWCVLVGPRGSSRQVWHLRYAGPDRCGDRNRRVISRGEWVRETAGTDDALFALACRIYDHELDIPEFTFPAEVAARP